MAVPTSMVSGQGNASAVSSPKTPEYPGRSSLPELLHCPKRTVSFGQSPSEGASQIPYQDDRERLNSTLQVAFTDNLRHGNNTSSPYKKVAVLLISWHANFDDLNTKAEVSPNVLGCRIEYQLCPRLTASVMYFRKLSAIRFLTFI